MAFQLTHWRHLPRDARDTLFLLAVIAWTVLPHLSHLPLWCSLLTTVVLLWRAGLALTNRPLPGRWVLAGVLLLAAALTIWSYRSLLGKEAGVTMAVLLMALKTLELRARRDAFVVFFLGFFLILTHFLYSQSLPVAAAMLISVWGLLTALVLAHMPVGEPGLRQAATLAARTALLGAPIMALMFLLFPRIGPLWGVPQDGASSTGLSNSMHMGSMAELAIDDSVALRIRFLGAVPPPESLYFRGPVFGRFDGVEWKSMPPPLRYGMVVPTELQVQGPPLRYEMTVEPLRLTVLPLLEAAASAPQVEGYRVTPRDDLRWITERPVTDRVRFQAEAYLAFRHGPQRPVDGLGEFVKLPLGFNPRTLEWAAALRREPRFSSGDARALAMAVLTHIRTSGFSYTLTPGSYGETNPNGAIDEFWLDRKQGFCEHFAAAFVVIMRAMGVPARVVTGYQGTDPEPVDGYFVVRQSSAHAWAEYWQPGIGWVRADPTAAIAPDRILRSRNLLPRPGLVAGALASMSPELLAQLRVNWEALNNRWNQWVLSYSRGQQLDLLQSLGFDSPSWTDLAMLLTIALSLLASGGAVWAWWDRHRVDPWVRQMDHIRKSLATLGLDAAAYEAPRSLSERVRGHFGAAGEALASMLQTIDQQRYSRAAVARPDRTLTRRFASTARQILRTR